MHGDLRIADFHGIVAIELDGERFWALRTDEPIHHTTVERTLVLVGPSLEATMQFAARLAAARQQILASDRLKVFGTVRRLYAELQLAGGVGCAYGSSIGPGQVAVASRPTVVHSLSRGHLWPMSSHAEVGR